MAKIKEPQKVLPFVGLIFVEDFFINELIYHLEKQLGPVAIKSSVIPFTHTTYYNIEMIGKLFRQWITFEELTMPDELIDLKHWTNSLEEKTLNENGGRMVNIDPGIITLSNLILASTKNYSHRIYLGKGIYAEVTLIYKDHQFRPLEWTYPDYRETIALEFFNEARKVLKENLSPEM